MDRVVRKRLSAGGLVLTGILLASALIAVRDGREPEVSHDFGAVKPRQLLHWKFAIENPTNRAVILSGFENACGVKAVLDRNPVLGPRESAVLTLEAEAPRRWGPSGAVFTLHRTAVDTNAKTEQAYSLLYEVAGKPSLDRSEMWLDANVSARCGVVGPFEKLEINSRPRSVSCQVVGEELSVTVKEDAPEGFLGYVEGQVTSGANRHRFQLPIYRRVSAGAPQLRPSVLVLERSAGGLTGNLKMLGALPDNLVVSAGSKSLKIRRSGRDLNMSAGSSTQFQTDKVQLRTANGRLLAEAVVLWPSR